MPFRTRQSLTISGLGSEVFLKSVLAAGEIHGAFKAVNPHLNFSAWQPRQSRGHTVLTFTNRYFTPDTEDGHEVRPFPSDLDPMRILRNAVPDGIYTTDNEVRYHDRQSVTGERCAIAPYTLERASKYATYQRLIHLPTHLASEYQDRGPGRGPMQLSRRFIQEAGQAG